MTNELLDKWLKMDELTDDERMELFESVDLEQQLQLDWLLDSGALDP